MKLIQFGDHHPVYFNFPESWDELSRRQLLAVGRYMESGKPLKRISSLVMGIMKPKWWQLRFQLRLLMLKAIQLLDFLTLTQFLFDDIEMSKWLMPRIHIGFNPYYGPGDKLRHVTLKEFSFTETYFVNYQAKQQAAYLDKLIATLYRPAKSQAEQQALDFNGDIRQPFNEAFIESRARKMHRLSLAKKRAILYSYIGNRNALVRMFPGLFTEKTSGSANRHGWASIILSLAGGIVHEEEVSRKPILQALIWLSDKDRENAEIEARIDKMKQK